MAVSFTIFKSIYDNKTTKKMSWDNFREFEMLLYKLSKEPLKDKRAATLISPASYIEGCTRANANVIEWSGWAAVDVDDHDFKGDLKEELAKLYGDFYFVCYSTASSSLENPKFRMVFPLKESVPGNKIKHFWFALNKELDDIGDPQTKDLSRMYYIPGNYHGANNFIFTNNGKIMDPNELIGKYKYVEKTGASFLDNLPESIRNQIIAHRKSTLTNTGITWNTYKDCPFVNQKILKDYGTISETGWYSKMFGIMVNIAGNAIRRKYPITSSEIVTLCREIDRDTGEWYKNRPFDVEAERAIEYIYSKNF
jgi:hypothetical protein